MDSPVAGDKHTQLKRTCAMYFLPLSSSLNTAGSAEEAIRINVSSLLRSAPLSGTSGYNEKLLMYACRGEKNDSVNWKAAEVWLS